MQIELTDYERVLLLGMIDMHLEGMADAREEMITDRASLDTWKVFTDTMQEHDIDVQTIKNIKEKVLKT